MPPSTFIREAFVSKAAEIKRLIAQLPPDEARDVAAFARLQVSGEFGAVKAPPAMSDKIDDLSRMVLEAIADCMSSKGIDFAPAARLARTSQYKSYQEKVGDFYPFLKQTAHGSKVKLQALVKLSVLLLYDDLQAMGVTFTSRTMLSHAHRIPAVLNKAFPGYAAHGLLGLVLRTEHEDKPKKGTKRVRQK